MDVIKAKDLKGLNKILNNMNILAVEYMGQTWKIGDVFYHKHEGRDIEDEIQGFDISTYHNLPPELRIDGEIYAPDAAVCYKLKKIIL